MIHFTNWSPFSTQFVTIPRQLWVNNKPWLQKRIQCGWLHVPTRIARRSKSEFNRETAPPYNRFGYSQNMTWLLVDGYQTFTGYGLDMSWIWLGYRYSTFMRWISNFYAYGLDISWIWLGYRGGADFLIAIFAFWNLISPIIQYVLPAEAQSGEHRAYLRLSVPKHEIS